MAGVSRIREDAEAGSRADVGQVGTAKQVRAVSEVEVRREVRETDEENASAVLPEARRRRNL
jgi:hypothetical protein